METNADGQPRPRVGIGIIIQNADGQVLLGLRKGAHGAGEWALPGGNIEFGETILDAAKREVKEETDLDIHKCSVIAVSDELRYLKSDNKHYVSIGILARYDGGEPKTMEPHKCEEWRWFDMDAVPENLFETTQSFLRNLRSGVIYQPNP